MIIKEVVCEMEAFNTIFFISRRNEKIWEDKIIFNKDFS